MYAALQSPGVLSRQIDLSQVVPSVAISQAAIAGVFPWGPINKPVVASSEQDLLNWFLRPSVFNAETWWTAADFLAYSNYLNVARAANYIGNTVTKSFVGNTTIQATVAGSNILQVGNTSGLQVGMHVFFSNNKSALLDETSSPINGAPVVTTITNATHVALSATALANSPSLQVVFRDACAYPAIGQEVADPTIDWEGQGILNPDMFSQVGAQISAGVTWVARYLGEPGNSLRVSQCDTANQFSSSVALVSNSTLINAAATQMAATVGSNTLVVTITPANTANTTMAAEANTVAGRVAASLAVGDMVQTGNSTLGFQYLSVVNVGAVVNTGNVYSLSIQMNDNYKIGGNTVSNTVVRYWEFFNLFSQPPGTSQFQTTFGNTAAQDELHIVVVDTLGRFTQNPGAVVEKYEGLSRAKDAKAIDGGSNYYIDVINKGSTKIWATHPRSTAPVATAQFLTSSTALAPLNIQFYGGASGKDESTVDVGTLTIAYQQFQSPEDFPDVSLIMQGKARGLGVTSNTQLGNYIVDNISAKREDMMAFISPDKALVINNKGYEAASMVAARLNMSYSSFSVIDSGYYYRYDQYNDIYWWVPLNGQIAGLCAQTDLTNAPWWSPAGVNRGKLKNSTRLAFNPKQAERDLLYNNDINSVVTMAGAGTMLYGDKTALGLASAFSRINVQRLFIVLRKSISRLARQFLFEFNDDFTRARFVATVTPYLKDVQGQRGITDFAVVCDKTNNTPEVIMQNQFVASIGVKPNYSINYIYLNFVAVRTDVSFSVVFGPNGSIG